MFTVHRWLKFIAVLVAALVVAGVSVANNSSEAQAADMGPSITVSGKYCPRAGSAWKRHMKISDSAKVGSKICTVKMNDASVGVNLNARIKFVKENDYRFTAFVKITPYAHEHHTSTDGRTEWWFTARADSAYMSGQGRIYMDEQGTVYFSPVPGKAFNVSVRWGMKTTIRYWSRSEVRFVKNTSWHYKTMKVRFTAVTTTK